MKKRFLFLGLAFGTLVVSCSEENSSNLNNGTNPVNGNKVLMLKVDLQTNNFEGGKVLDFEEAESFTISNEYVSPGDFGSIKLIYEETEETIFDGTIIWDGTGEMSYPEVLDAPSTFAVMDDELEMPELSDFEVVQYGDNGEIHYALQSLDEEAIWESVNHLQQVADFRASNPNAKIHLFLYAPSVGIGDPADWDWFVILKN